MRTPLIAGNWKMHKTVAESVELVEALLSGLGNITDREVLVCPPYTALHALGSLLQDTPIDLGAQDVFYEDQGAYTGAISSVMLRDVGCTYTIVGHSERRQVFGEGDEIINRKLHAALGHGLRVILCVGETKDQRDAGMAEKIVTGQVQAGLVQVTPAQLANIVIAYEPVWAIGTGDTATSADAQSMHATIRQTLTSLYDEVQAQQMRIQYGGSVKPDNVDELMSQPDIDGALVGGAALKADSFLRIVQFR
ncbi:MAG: triose-phosphate isomerase [Chloroflexi bacterium AL-W]|nr:triose-phosphate isomerase [Chloroflexi bacterium AL-N1]NOK65710.1 triose-phosphate isomerase [Chloroflexi bacterium AL-N10]NOK74349.1 triose-phosphate isomerase [Chloroflexi bacterium AL-N5]NOK80743.1 triose-phosphate isomerase [Chloroflexi bacterium AL-W]NOK88607.1 triose-phosphate isomerase [Chloroflexi bacterium AL-N15]